jgi:photosystem II stability/assembly factor-like uncharacterized protein
MKIYLIRICILSFFLLNTSIFSQWRDFHSNISENLKSIYFTTSITGFAVGGNNILGYTLDNGFRSVTTDLDSNSIFNSLDFSNSENGYIVGFNSHFNSGIVVRTTNGGANWSSEFQILGSTNLEDVFFTNQLTGWTTGNDYTSNKAIIGKTSDGGISWSIEAIPNIESGIFNSIYFVNEYTGWVAGTGDTTGYGKILKTTNGGLNWDNIFVSINGDLKDIYFSNESVGWICTSSGMIFKTSDGGSNWVNQFTNSESINSLSFVDENFGWAAGDNGLVIRTTNGGISWVSENSETTKNLFSISANYNNVVRACGENGKIITREIFTPLTDLTPMSGSSAVGDYDNDGDLDIALTGVMVTWALNPTLEDGKYTEIYKNDGLGSFTKINTPFIKVSDGSLDFGDFDNDGDLDLLLAGFFESDTLNGCISKLYRNDGNDVFVELAINFNGFDRGFLQWGDLDNDGDLDIVSSNGIYRNDGNESFTEMNTSISGYHFASGKLGDLDNDGDLDLFGSQEGDVPKIYQNNGSFNFSEIVLSMSPQSGYYESSILKSARKITTSEGPNSIESYYGTSDLGDYDSDGDLDLLWMNPTNSIIYKNEGNLVFTIPELINLPGLMTGTGTFGDFDNDGDLDVFLTGGNTYNDRASGIYRNDGNEIFVQQPFYYRDEDIISWASVDCGDFDNDGDLDLLILGETYHSNGVTKIFSNNSLITNNFPSSPINLQSLRNNFDILLHWDKSTDFETIQNGLTYNIIIGSDSSELDIISPMSDLSNGYRRIVSQGNTNHNSNWQIKNLPHGRHYWRVQAIDNNFAGSVFSEIKSFGIPYCTSNSVIPGGSTNPITFDTTLVTVQFINANGSDLDISVERFEFSPGGTLPPNLQNLADVFWTAKVNQGVVTGTFNIILNLSDVTGISNYSLVHLLKRDSETSPWVDLGTPSDTSGGPSAIEWSGFTGFFEFGICESDNIIPVELSSFKAIVNQSKVNLNWRTETELNNLGFEIERYSNSNWQKIGFVEGHGNSVLTQAYFFVDNYPHGANKFSYRLKQIDNNGSYKYSNVVEVSLIPDDYALYQNYPNPFNPTTKIRFQIPYESKVVIKIYNVLGAEVKEILNEPKEAGIFEVEFNADELSSGTYIYKIIADNFVQTKKMILLK